ncbi:MAG: lysine--tRNA ligase [Pseudonocardiaceae bacterium]|nr:lysine--tRNA ligase [Pseudonocardiaceae bacterium]
MNDSRTWMDRLADEVATRAKPGTTGAQVVCASGISPSGPIHMGNLREVFTTHLVVEALRRRRVDAVHLHSWDDYDRLRKVPPGVGDSYQRYVGMPLSAVPDPWGETDSYALHFIEEFTAALAALGIRMREITQSTQYSRGTYNAAIRRAMDCRELVFDTLAEQQTPGRHDRSEQDRRREYFPFRPYCEVCGKDDTRVEDYRDETVHYVCRCAHRGAMSLADGVKISGKLVWKVDWPMRWAHEGVAFEPAGEDHHAPTGSFTVGHRLVESLYGGGAPHSTVYSFVSLAGASGKMSGSAGGAAVPSTVLDVLEPALVRWLYARRLPEQSFSIDLSPQPVQRLYDEWDRTGARAADGSGDPMEARVRSYCVSTSDGQVATTPRPVPFRLLGSTADVTAANRTQIIRIVRQHLPSAERDIVDDQLEHELEPRLSCAVNWATRLLPPEQRTIIASSFNATEWDRLDDDTRQALRDLAGRLGESWDLDELTALVYSVPKLMLGLASDAEPTPEIKKAQREFFKVMYRLLCDSDTGPRLPTLLLSIGLDRSRRLLSDGVKSAPSGS